MTDHSNGTYTYDFTSELNGKITVMVYLLKQGVYNRYYDGTSWSGPVEKEEFLSTIDRNWGIGFFFGAILDRVTIRYFFYIKSPITGTVNLR